MSKEPQYRAPCFVCKKKVEVWSLSNEVAWFCGDRCKDKFWLKTTCDAIEKQRDAG